jgi:hypothetical protein
MAMRAPKIRTFGHLQLLSLGFDNLTCNVQSLVSDEALDESPMRRLVIQPSEQIGGGMARKVAHGQRGDRLSDSAKTLTGPGAQIRQTIDWNSPQRCAGDRQEK